MKTLLLVALLAAVANAQWSAMTVYSDAACTTMVKTTIFSTYDLCIPSINSRFNVTGNTVTRYSCAGNVAGTFAVNTCQTVTSPVTSGPVYFVVIAVSGPARTLIDPQTNVARAFTSLTAIYSTTSCSGSYIGVVGRSVGTWTCLWDVYTGNYGQIGSYSESSNTIPAQGYSDANCQTALASQISIAVASNGCLTVGSNYGNVGTRWAVPDMNAITSFTFTNSSNTITVSGRNLGMTGSDITSVSLSGTGGSGNSWTITSASISEIVASPSNWNGDVQLPSDLTVTVTATLAGQTTYMPTSAASVVTMSVLALAVAALIALLTAF